MRGGPDTGAESVSRHQPGGHDELAEKARFWNSETVNARLADAFPGGDRSHAAILIAGLVGEVAEGADEDSDEASCRLMLDAIKVSEGSLQRLAMWVEAARVDPRDLIAAAEYARELGAEGAGTDPGEARVADLVDYVAWAGHLG